ncbi:MAG: hypothetical protein Q9157_003819 [Trypethelium eluteriae]
MRRRDRAGFAGPGHRYYSDSGNNDTVTFYANETCGVQTETIVYTTRNATVTQVTIFSPPCGGPVMLHSFDQPASPVNTFMGPVTPSPAPSAGSIGMGGVLPPAAGATSRPQTVLHTSAPVPRPASEGPGIPQVTNIPQATNSPVANPAEEDKSVAGVVSAIQTLAQALPVIAEPDLGASGTYANPAKAGLQGDALGGLVPEEPQSGDVESVASRIVSQLVGSSGQDGSEPGGNKQDASMPDSGAQKADAPDASGPNAGEPEVDGSDASGSEASASGSSSVGSSIVAAMDIESVKGAMQDESAGGWNAGEAASPPNDQSTAAIASYAPERPGDLAKLVGIISDAAGSHSSPANEQAEPENGLTDVAGEEELSSNDPQPGPSAVTVGNQIYSAVMSISQDGTSANELFEEAVVTLGTQVLTAEAFSGTSATLVMLGSRTLTVGGPAITAAGETVSAATNGIVIDGTMDAFSTITVSENGALSVSASRATNTEPTEPAAPTAPEANNEAGLSGNFPRVFWLSFCSWMLFTLG